jgi:putative component of membrane protein insertase Oxa1/YidC/SpoIIIJ protein YidD
MKTFLVFIILCTPLLAQTDWGKWETAEVSYELRPIDKKNYQFDTGSLDGLIMSSMKNIYYFTISDLDGDNCPFYPSCSNFYVSAVKQTNIFQGTLMFADRFTRDSNLFKSRNHYKYYSHGKFHDPVELYTLKEKIIDHIPQKSVVDD